MFIHKLINTILIKQEWQQKVLMAKLKQRGTPVDSATLSRLVRDPSKGVDYRVAINILDIGYECGIDVDKLWEKEKARLVRLMSKE